MGEQMITPEGGSGYLAPLSMPLETDTESGTEPDGGAAQHAQNAAAQNVAEAG